MHPIRHGAWLRICSTDPARVGVPVAGVDPLYPKPRAIRSWILPCGVWCLLGALVAFACVPAERADDLRADAERALRQGQFREAEELASRAIEREMDAASLYVLRGQARRRLGKTADAIVDFTKAIALEPTAAAYVARGDCYSAGDRHDEAIADFDRALQRDAKSRAALHARGRERFKRGDVAASIADFDRVIELDPSHKDECWERGLARYFAGRFRAAQQSFEDYHQVGPEDIENGLWRLLSQAEVDGFEEAQRALYRYEPKRRPPFPLLYDLYAGKAVAATVLAHAGDGAADEADRTNRLFYAELYVGLWFAVKRDRAAATEHLAEAVARRSSDYMWYVARLELARLESRE